MRCWAARDAVWVNNEGLSLPASKGMRASSPNLSTSLLLPVLLSKSFKPFPAYHAGMPMPMPFSSFLMCAGEGETMLHFSTGMPCLQGNACVRMGAWHKKGWGGRQGEVKRHTWLMPRKWQEKGRQAQEKTEGTRHVARQEEGKAW